MILQLGWRNLWRNPRRTVVILTAIVVGIISMVVLSAFGRGMMDGMVKNSIDNLVGHIKIIDPNYRADPVIENSIAGVERIIEELEDQLPDNSRLVKRLKLDGVLSTSREHTGIIMVGIEPNNEVGVSFIGRPVHAGQALKSDDLHGLIIGQALLERLDLDIGKKVVLLSQDRVGEASSRAFRIRSTFRTELRDTEKQFVFVNLAAFQEMIGAADRVTEIGINLQSGNTYGSGEIERLIDEINGKIGSENLEAIGWKDLLPAIHAYIEMFDIYMLIWFVVVFIAMGFGLANTVLMAVYERMREFGLQRALGLRSTGIIRVVILEVLLLLVIGIAVANGASWFLVKIVFNSGIDLGVFGEGIEMWGISRVIYPVLSFKDVVMANAVVMILGLLVGLYPALHAARFTPVETMRHV